MWFLILLTLANASLDQKGIVLQNRINLGSLPINLLDGLLAIGVLCAIVGPFLSKNRFRTENSHPAFRATLILFFIAALFGAIGGSMHGARIYGFANDLRNVTAFPLSMFACYYFLKTPRSNVWYAYVFVISGIMTAGLITVYFMGKSAEESASSDVETIRAIQYVSWYAGLVAALLLFNILNRGVRLFPLVLAILILAFCLIGQFGTLSRSDWVATFGALFTIPFLLPRKDRGLRVAGFVLAVPLLFGIIWGGAAIGSKLVNRDLTEHLSRRIMSILPGRGDDAYDSHKAWDTRLPGMKKEFGFFLDNPLMGQGFEYTNRVGDSSSAVAFNHNVWASQAALMGIFGFLAYFVPVIAIIVVGRRMVFDATDRGSVLMGVLGATTGVFALIIGAATMSFNTQRGALLVGATVGIVLRARAMQLQMLRQHDFYEDDGYGPLADEAYA